MLYYIVINFLRKTFGKLINNCGEIAYIHVYPCLPCSIHLLQEFVRLSTGLYIRPSMVFIHPLAFPCSHSSSTEGIRSLLLMSLTSVPHSLSSFICHMNLFVRALISYIRPSLSLRICSLPTGLYIPIRPSTHVWSKLITYLKGRGRRTHFWW